MTIAPEAPPVDDKRSLPAVMRRRLAPIDERLDRNTALAFGIVTLVAGLLRFVGLSKPPGKIFDEVYYAVDGHNLWRLGYEWDEKNNTAGYVVHPPLGKWIIGAGEQLFGYNEFGWRFFSAVFGTASVLLFMLVARRLFGSTILACAAGLLMTFDGAHFVLSRSALLDIFLMFFCLLGFYFLLLDRDQRRRRWLRFVEDGGDPTGRGRASRPPFAVPWWRLATFTVMGLACSVKWSALFFIPIMVILLMWWEAGARRSVGVRNPVADTILDEGLWLIACLVLVVGVYIASWSGWLLTDGGYNRHGLANTGHHEVPVIGALINLVDYHQQALKFHTGLADTHTYQSWPWQWLLLGRPVAFYWSSTDPCGSASCAAEVVLNGTPLLWWSFLPALVALVWMAVSRRDWRAWALTGMIAFGWLPWFYFEWHDHRTMFFFYAQPIEPFLILAVVYVLASFMTVPAGASWDGGVRADDGRVRMTAAVVLGAYVMLVALNFAYFYPIFTGQSIPYDAWMHRMWLGNRWI
jgi:dolichyl-phosphate-mannose-protein mannosyltransferase